MPILLTRAKLLVYLSGPSTYHSLSRTELPKREGIKTRNTLTRETPRNQKCYGKLNDGTRRKETFNFGKHIRPVVL